MVRLFSRSRPLGSSPPGAGPAMEAEQEGAGLGGCVLEGSKRRRRAPLSAGLNAVVAVGLCAVAACALFAPELFVGTGRSTAAPAVGGSSAVSSTLPDTQSLESRVIPAVATSAAAVSSGVLLATLPWGSEDGQVGLAAPGEGLIRGPEALAVAPDRRIAILDSVNKWVVLLDAGGAFMASVPVDLAEPRFLAVSDDRLYVLDCDADRRLLTFDWGGTNLGALSIPDLTDVVTGLFATDGGPALEVAHESTFLLESSQGSLPVAAAATDVAAPNTAEVSSGQDGPAVAHLRALAGRPIGASLGRAAKVTFEPGRGPRAKLFSADVRGLQATQTVDASLDAGPGRVLEHLVSVDGDGGDGLIVGARLLRKGPSAGEASLWLGRFQETANQGPGAGSSMGKGVGAIARPIQTLFLRDSPFAYLGQPYIVTPDGHVYQPVADEEGYRILVHSFIATDTVTAKEGQL